MTPRILQFGRSGQLARAISERASARRVRLHALARTDADLRDPAGCADRLRREAAAAGGVEVVVIAAGFTRVDAAEAERDEAETVNATTPGAIAAAAASLDIPVLLVSTDHVFDGVKGRPYLETDTPNPINHYGATKLAGEVMLANANPRHAVLRAAWLFDGDGVNFPRALLERVDDASSLPVVDDQVNAPTPTAALADAILALSAKLADPAIGEAAQGVFHFTCLPAVSKAAFAGAVLDAAAPWLGRRPRVSPIPSSSFPTPARRPLDTRLDSARFTALTGMAAPDWRPALTAATRRICADLGAAARP